MVNTFARKFLGMILTCTQQLNQVLSYAEIQVKPEMVCQRKVKILYSKVSRTCQIAIPFFSRIGTGVKVMPPQGEIFLWPPPFLWHKTDQLCTEEQGRFDAAATIKKESH
jgi:uncharacterized protein YifN (PemK superfamily)